MKATAVALALVLSGCYSLSARKANVEGVTTDRPTKAGEYRRVGQRVEKRACSTWLALFFSFGDRTDHVRLAEEVLKESDADLLADAKMTSHAWGMPLLFGRYCTAVTGQPVVARAEQKAQLVRNKK